MHHSTSWTLGRPGVGERPWWMTDTPLPPDCQQRSLLCYLRCVEGLQATAESTLLSPRKVVRVWIMKVWSASHWVHQQLRRRILQRSSPVPPGLLPANQLWSQEQPWFSNMYGSGARTTKIKRAWTTVGQVAAANELFLASTLPYARQCRKSSR